MASPPPPGTVKKETISVSLDNGKGTLLVIRPGKNGQQLGQLNQFDYEGNAAMKILDALAVARRQLEEKIAAAKTIPAVKTTPKAPAVVIDPDEGDASLPVVPDDEEDNEETADTADTADDAPETAELEPEPDEPIAPAAPFYAAAVAPNPTTVAQATLFREETMRIFKPDPSTEIAETPATEGKSIEEVKRILATLGHPQVLNSIVQETPRGEDTVFSFVAAAGKKG